MQHSSAIELRVDICLEAAKERQPILAIAFIEFITYFRKRIAYLEHLNKEQAGYINMHQSINSNPVIGSYPQEAIQGMNPPYMPRKKFWKI